MAVLLLNADAQPLNLMPLSVISWQNAVKAYFAEKVKIVASHENKILHSARFEMPMPSVVMLVKYHKQPTKAKFTRKNMFIRDNFTCQYCGERSAMGHLTIDHVLPRSHGGRTTWTNCTTACKPCNWSKSNNLNILPSIKPVQPSWFEINNKARMFKINIPDEKWQDFIKWPDDLVHINENLASI